MAIAVTSEQKSAAETIASHSRSLCDGGGTGQHSQ